MSSANEINESTFTVQPAPQHHVHKDSEPLPGARGAALPAADYSTEVTNDPQTWSDSAPKVSHYNPIGTKAMPIGGTLHSAFHEERPLGVAPVRSGVAVGGDESLPAGNASLADKAVGKAQKIVGKAMHKSELHEKGELREAGGKAAAMGEARAPHD